VRLTWDGRASELRTHNRQRPKITSKGTGVLFRQTCYLLIDLPYRQGIIYLDEDKLSSRINSRVAGCKQVLRIQLTGFSLEGRSCLTGCSLKEENFCRLSENITTSRLRLALMLVL
jgi:hypothetical protein